MNTFKAFSTLRLPALIGGVILALGMAWSSTANALDKPDEPKTPDSSMASQFAEMQAKLARLEVALAKNTAPMATVPATTAMPGMPVAAATANPAMGMDKMKPAATAMAATAPMMPAGMMAMMDKMMGMMDKMMPMNSTATPAAMATPMPAVIPTAMPAAAGMGMDKMEMGGMMGMGTMSSSAAATMSQSALPGFPGHSHLYHIGATGFFLDHPQHIALTIEQQAALNKAKEQALLAKSTADRAVEQAEQALWTLTAADQPDATQIEAKIREIEKLRGDERLAFIHAVGDASKLITEEQRKILTGFAAPVSASPAPAPVAAMKGM